MDEAVVGRKDEMTGPGILLELQDWRRIRC
jgi:hypothetical protein